MDGCSLNMDMDVTLAYEVNMHDKPPSDDEEIAVRIGKKAALAVKAALTKSFVPVIPIVALHCSDKDENHNEEELSETRLHQLVYDGQTHSTGRSSVQGEQCANSCKYDECKEKNKTFANEMKDIKNEPIAKTEPSTSKEYFFPQAAKSTAPKKKRCLPSEKSFVCGICNMAFYWASRITEHMRIHTGIKPYSCAQCGAVFSRSYYLSRHMRRHTGDRPFKCSQCGAMFARSSDLTRHKRSHAGKKPYKCDQCTAAFVLSHHLTQHKQTHSNIRPFICKECGMDFLRFHDRVAHMRTHSGDRPYKCTLCKAAFSRAGDVTRHMRIHTGDKPYKCPQCDAKFAHSHHLSRHKQKKH